MAKNIAIIGVGRVGSAIGRLLAGSGFNVAAVADRTPEIAQTGVDFIGHHACVFENPADAVRNADIVFLTTPDPVIKEVCESISRHGAFRRGSAVFHCSGGYSSDLLVSARSCRAFIGSIHPLQSCATPQEAARNLEGAFYFFECDPEIAPLAKEIAAALKGTAVEIRPECKMLYHAGAVVASNYLVTLVSIAGKMLEESGVPKDLCVKALLPLVQGTVNNIGNMGVPDALTGPIARGDAANVRGHVEAIEEHLPRVSNVYRLLGFHTVDVSLAKGGINGKQADALREELERSAGLKRHRRHTGRHHRHSEAL
jgi:predicted short-subunit dehydrogenase-like oxidoreductase (DUF2520 family)